MDKKLADLKITDRAMKTISLMADLIEVGAECWLKWTCVHCGMRQAFDKPNVVYTAGGKCERCGRVTDVLQDARAHTDLLVLQELK